MQEKMKLSLGPVLTYWARETLFEFYQMVAQSEVDIVYIGEAVCSRRHEMRLDDWLDVADRYPATNWLRLRDRRRF